ncbi:MAG: PSD1 and planctomycete cytochrome C domain-containing protein [Spartobacteria bacterium]
MKKSTLAILPCLLILPLASCKKAPEAAVANSSEKTEPAPASAPANPAAPATAPAPAAEKISFSSQVRPILSNSCFACHGPDSHNQTSPFRLDTEEHSRANLAKAGEPPRYGVVPGKPEVSLLLQRIATHDPNEIMPPPYAKKPALTEEQIATVAEWIRQGAKYEPHWAFVTPVKPALPEVKDKAWPRTPIDNFILAKLESKGIKPSPEADKETLVRRVHMDLLGLPPTPEEIDAYMADTSDKAYENMVDRALASPHYGERMAIDWLDVARYGDNNALHNDMHRTSWPWRDWVINAFNKNMPYDQFLTEQLAGDLLPNATLDQKLATSFNRNHGINNESGSIPEEWLTHYAVDRVSTYGTAVMGMTVACAQCHDHKYDPISQNDFFSLMAYFNSINEAGIELQNASRARAYPPFIYVPTAHQKQVMEGAEKSLAALQPVRDDKAPEAIKVPDESKGIDWALLSPVGAAFPSKSISGQANPNIDNGSAQGSAMASINLEMPENKNRFYANENSVHPIFPVSAGEEMVLEFALPETPLNTVRIDSVNPFFFLWNYQFDGVEPVLGMDLATIRQALPDITLELEQGGKREPLPVAAIRSTFQGLSPELAAAQAADPANSWKLGIPGIDSSAFLQLAAPLTPAKGAKLIVKLKFQGSEATYGCALSNSFRVATANNPHGLEDWLALFKNKDRQYWMNDTWLAAKAHAAGKSPATGLDLARAHYLKNHFENCATRVAVMEERPTPVQTFVLERGAYDKPLKNRPRERTTPATFPPLPKDAPKNRLGLAQWSVAPENPLTARVQVNRLWQQLFRNGIVKTSDDFGLQSSLPTHPELLDYLAVDFRENKWDIKRTMKNMAMSAAYRQSSDHREDLKEIDPENKLLARAPRYRFQAELIRDNALAASGLLNEQVGGPSFKTYQPEIWKEKTMKPNSNFGFYVRHTGDKLFRRGLYTFWKQSVPPAQMEIFDAPSREFCTTRRALTNSPTQAFVLMNDETYLEFSRKLAERLFKDIDGPWQEKLGDRIRRGLRLATGRTPDGDDLESWVSFSNENLARFNADPANAEKFLSYGETPREESLPPAELAALSFTMSAILNLDETITRD